MGVWLKQVRATSGLTKQPLAGGAILNHSFLVSAKMSNSHEKTLMSCNALHRFKYFDCGVKSHPRQALITPLHPRCLCRCVDGVNHLLLPPGFPTQCYFLSLSLTSFEAQEYMYW